MSLSLQKARKQLQESQQIDDQPIPMEQAADPQLAEAANRSSQDAVSQDAVPQNAAQQPRPMETKNDQPNPSDLSGSRSTDHSHSHSAPSNGAPHGNGAPHSNGAPHNNGLSLNNSSSHINGSSHSSSNGHSSNRTELKTDAFGSFEHQTAQTPIYFAGNPLNRAKAQWGLNQCGYSQTFKFLTGKDTEPCGRAERLAESCENCQRIQPFFMRLEWTREIPAKDVPGLGALMNQSFPLPEGCRLLVFTSEQAAKDSPWGTAPRVHSPQYVFVNQQGQQAVCFHNCKVCRRCELKPVAGANPSLFCRNGDANKISVVKKDDESSKRAISATVPSSRGFGRPDPCRFIFSEDTFPVDVRLPAAVLMRQDALGQTYYLGAEDIVVFFDDVLMPYRIVNNTVIVEVRKNPFEKLYRPREYDNLAVTVIVYRRSGRVPIPGLNLVAPNANTAVSAGQSKQRAQETVHITAQSMDTNPDSNPAVKQEKKSEEKNTQEMKANGEGNHPANGVEPIVLYKSTYRFYMRSPDLGDGASDSESDEDEQAIPRGVVAKRRYHMADHLQLAMTFKGQEAFYTVIQGYLRGGFFAGSQQERLKEKSNRNARFTEVMQQDVPVARKYVAEMLIEVGQYYLKHCRQEPDFLDGLKQLLDFAHSLGAFGFAAFKAILANSPLVPTDKPICFRFPRKFGTEVRNVLVTATPNGEISEITEGDPSTSKQRQGSKDDDLTADFEIPAFAKLSISDEPTAFDKLQQEKAQIAKFAPPTGLNPGFYLSSQGRNASNSSVPSSELKDKVESKAGNDDPLVNPNFCLIPASEQKSLNEQLGAMNQIVTSYPTRFKIEKGSMTNLLKAVQEAGYMSPTDANNSPVSEITKSFWQAMLTWAVVQWPFDLSKTVQGGINETTFVAMMGQWLNSKQYASLSINYAKNLHVSHLRKLFRLFTNDLAPRVQSDPNKAPSNNSNQTPRLMGPVAFVQCVGLMLMPNNLQRTDHNILAHHGPFDLGSAIDCIYDAATEPETGPWLALYRGPMSRAVLEASLRAYIATEQKEKGELPLIMRLPEVRVEGTTGYGLNLHMCFQRKGEFKHVMLAVDVYDEQNNCATRLLDALGQPQKCFGDWLLDLKNNVANGVAPGARRARYTRKKKFRGADVVTSE